MQALIALQKQVVSEPKAQNAVIEHATAEIDDRAEPAPKRVRVDVSEPMSEIEQFYTKPSVKKLFEAATPSQKTHLESMLRGKTQMPWKNHEFRKLYAIIHYQINKK